MRTQMVMQHQAGPLIAVVDDDSAFIDLMAELLVDEGFAVISALSPSGAFERLRQVQPALVILDLHMAHPEGGWQIFSMLRHTPETARIPVLVCSADHRMLRAKRSLIQRQGGEVLEKPFHLERLLSMVRTMLA